MITNDDLKTLIECVKGTVEDIKSGNEAFLKDYGNHREECKEVKESVTVLNKKVEYLDKKDRSKNLLLFDFKDDADTNKDLLKSVMKVFESAKIGIAEESIDSVKRLGQAHGKCPVLVTFLPQRIN